MSKWAKCDKCGRAIRFMNGNKGKRLVVNPSPVRFVPDLTGGQYFIHAGALRRGTRAQDGLLGYTFHNCEGI